MPQSHTQDILIVKNIDKAPFKVISDIVQKPHTVFDPAGQPISTYYEDIIEEWNTEKGFKVKWGGKSQVIKVGEKKLMPRFLAEHFAKHLADHILQKEAERTGNKAKPIDAVSRKKVLQSIVVGVYSYYLSDDEVDEAMEVVNQVETLNKNFKDKDEINGGEYKSELDDLGLEKVDEFDAEEDETTDLPPETSTVDVKKAKKGNLNDKDAWPEIDELKEQCEAMGIEVSGKETAEELVGKLKAFA
jgi:hypothetical protein